jgi:hypothetical protein
MPHKGLVSWPSSRSVKSQRSAVPSLIRPESRAGGVNASTAVTILKNTMQETRAEQNPGKLACAVGGDATQYRRSSLCSLTPHADHSSLPFVPSTTNLVSREGANLTKSSSAGFVTFQAISDTQ